MWSHSWCYESMGTQPKPKAFDLEPKSSPYTYTHKLVGQPVQNITRRPGDRGPWTTQLLLLYVPSILVLRPSPTPKWISSILYDDPLLKDTIYHTLGRTEHLNQTYTHSCRYKDGHIKCNPALCSRVFKKAQMVTIDHWNDGSHVWMTLHIRIQIWTCSLRFYLI